MEGNKTKGLIVVICCLVGFIGFFVIGFFGQLMKEVRLLKSWKGKDLFMTLIKVEKQRVERAQ